MSTSEGKNRRTSPIWNFFDIIDRGNALCTICKNRISFKSSVTNLRRHLEKRHRTVTVPNARIPKLNEKIKPELILSTSTESESKRRRTSPIWNFFDIIDNANALCTICKRKVSYKSSVTNLRRHLERKHRNVRIPKSSGPNYSIKKEHPPLSTSDASVTVKEQDTKAEDESYDEEIIYFDYGDTKYEETEEQQTALPKLKKQNRISDTFEPDVKVPLLEGYTLSKNNSENKSEEQDEVDAYVMLLSKKLRKFNEDDREVVMNEIDNFIFQKRITLKRNPIDVPPTPSPSSSSNFPL